MTRTTPIMANNNLNHYKENTTNLQGKRKCLSSSFEVELLSSDRYNIQILRTILAKYAGYTEILQMIFKVRQYDRL